MNPDVNFFFERETPWQSAYLKLRTIVLKCGLKEELKWGVPCYTLNGKNVILIHGFKDYCALLFHKGALMKDPAGILVQQTPNVQAARQIRFRHLRDITELESTLKNYIQDAITTERSGSRVLRKATADYTVPEEFLKKLEQVAGLKAAFQALTPGRQRSYLFFFAQAKQSGTRMARVEKCIPQILSGKGLDDI